MSLIDYSFILATLLSTAGLGSVLTILFYLATFVPFALYMVLDEKFETWHKLLAVRTKNKTGIPN
jgi:hypothetical protein